MRHTGHIHIALIDERDVIGLRRLIASEAKSEPRIALSNASQARAISTRPRMAGGLFVPLIRKTEYCRSWFATAEGWRGTEEVLIHREAPEGGISFA